MNEKALLEAAAKALNRAGHPRGANKLRQLAERSPEQLRVYRLQDITFTTHGQEYPLGNLVQYREELRRTP